MKLPADSIIAREKLAGYLLRPRDDHDKAAFLALAGYGAAHAEKLEADLRTQILPLEATAAGATAFLRRWLEGSQGVFASSYFAAVSPGRRCLVLGLNFRLSGAF